ncbi:MAG: CDP-alcohol phosphatidyltransferase family protein [Candidatus Lokiarchaeota archaeon]|nr:CDP-alcohol phosphatidyltransferase family protein [Candidatus Lokiarchaeota archaeon]
MSSNKIPQLLKLKDFITLIGTSLGIIALICACLGTRATLSLGFFLISISTGTDMIDGYIARKTNTVNELGKELDSLSDSLTFGIAPAVLAYQSFKTNSLFDIVLIIGAICFAFGAILRLARFNLSNVPGYTGVPTPISALLLIVFFYANYFYAFGMGGITYPFLEIAYYLLPFIMIMIAWFNITTFISFGEKDKTVYIVFLILAPFCPIFGIIGVLNPNFLVSMIVSVFFLSTFLFALIFIFRGFFLYRSNKKKNK